MALTFVKVEAVMAALEAVKASKFQRPMDSAFVLLSELEKAGFKLVRTPVRQEGA